MHRIHGDPTSLLAALTAHWAEQQLQIPQHLRPVVAPDQPLDQTHALSGTRLTWLVDLVGRLATAHQRQGEQDPAVQQGIGAA
jgi:hypothetical protein